MVQPYILLVNLVLNPPKYSQHLVLRLFFLLLSESFKSYLHIHLEILFLNMFIPRITRETQFVAVDNNNYLWHKILVWLYVVCVCVKLLSKKKYGST